MVLQQLAPEAILSVQLLIPQLYNYRIIVQLSEVTLIDFCIAPIIAVRLGQIFHVMRIGKYYCKNMRYRINIYIYHAKSRLNTPVWGSLRSPNNFTHCYITLHRLQVHHLTLTLFIHNQYNINTLFIHTYKYKYYELFYS